MFDGEPHHGLTDVAVRRAMSRHVLWAMPDPAGALEHWIALLRPGGRSLLVEGRWSTGPPTSDGSS